MRQLRSDRILLGGNLPLDQLWLRRIGLAGLSRASVAYGHDLLVAGLSLPLALLLRLGSTAPADYPSTLWLSIPIFMLIAGASFHTFGMYRGVWRYASIPDLVAILKAVSLAVLVFMPVMFLVDRLEETPRSVPFIQWLLLIVLLGGPRLGYRSMRNGYLTADRSWKASADRSTRQIPVLVLGTCEDAVLFIRSMSDDPDASYRVVGLLDQTSEHLGRSIHGVPVLGTAGQLAEVIRRIATRGLRPQRLIIASQRGSAEVDLVDLLNRADDLGLTVVRLPRLVEFKEAVSGNAKDGKLDVQPIPLEDLLERPQAPLNRAAIRALIGGRKVLVTGAGGTIGSELTRHIAALGPAQLTMVDQGEFNLYSIDLEIRERHPGLALRPVLCNIRERERVMQVFAEIRPDLVFHAAALKHVPMVESNPAEGLHTNVAGTRNVADAMAEYGTLAMVQVSTDKAINPSSMMGKSKRLAELYSQSLDLAGAALREGAAPAPRFMTVRFGNVLGSSGSVVPLFQRQLAQGGPLTVTHPEITRFFMTVREAVELVLQASAHGVAHPEPRGQIFVLDMGRPIKIVEIARQMIRLAGLKPDQDVQIEFTGLRPGEKLYEELFDANEERLPAATAGILVAASRPISLEILRHLFDDLAVACQNRDFEAIQRLTSHLLSDRARWPAAAAARLPA